MRLLILSLLVSYTLVGHAVDLTGRVTEITDGDTLKILDESNIQYKIRLAAIDAPEKAQAFGQKAKSKLSDLCFGKSAIIKVVDVDKYGRTVGEINCTGINANEAMVHSGFAWVYRKYAKGYAHLFTLEDEARASRLGLWADVNPIPPWEWRKKNHQ